MEIKTINTPEYTLYLAIYPLDDLKKDIHNRDVLYVYPFKTTLYSNDKLMDIVEHLLGMYQSYIGHYGERLYSEIIIYQDNAYYDHDNDVVSLDPTNNVVRYGCYDPDDKTPECDIAKFKCIDIVNKLRNESEITDTGDIK